MPLGARRLAELTRELGLRGWAAVPGVRTREDLVALGEALGSLIPRRDGELVRVLTPTPSGLARRGTLSSRHGTGKFPLHTDTAFWPTPARYVLMVSAGDQQRRTLLCPFDRLLGMLQSTVRDDLLRAVWRVHTRLENFYCSTRFSVRNAWAWRCDTATMIPTNAAAIRSQVQIKNALDRVECDEFQWHDDEALVIANWHVLHGRGARPNGELKRVLLRLYVR